MESEVAVENARMESGLAKSVLKGTLVGQLAHFAVCPLHGLPGLLIKAGVISGMAASPFVAAHDYLVDDVVAPALSYVRQDSKNEITTYGCDSHEGCVSSNINYEIAHDIVDYSGWALAIGTPLMFAGASMYRRRKK